jgi:hypothetical protein
LTTKSEILHEVRDAMVAAERKHGDQMDVPLGCHKSYAPAAEAAKRSTDNAFLFGTGTWMHIAYEEAMECFAEEDLEKIRAEALQAAAMFAQIARVCDHLKEKEAPLKATDRVYSPDYGWGTVRNVVPNGEIAWILWDGENGILASKKLGTMYSLSWARRLDRAK